MSGQDVPRETSMVRNWPLLRYGRHAEPRLGGDDPKLDADTDDKSCCRTGNPVTTVDAVAPAATASVLMFHVKQAAASS
jgi:hypothetical protein